MKLDQSSIILTRNEIDGAPLLKVKPARNAMFCLVELLASHHQLPRVVRIENSNLDALLTFREFSIAEIASVNVDDEMFTCWTYFGVVLWPVQGGARP